MAFLTQSMPAFAAAALPALDPQVVRSLMQSFGNCGLPSVHRGPITVVPTVLPTFGKNGALERPRWNPTTYRDIIGNAGGARTRDIDLAGFSSNWNVTSYGGDNFSFPTSQTFNNNSYYGGNTTNIGGNSVFNNSYSTNSYVTNTYTTTINGHPAPGTPGAEGPAGAAGADGGAGPAGANGTPGMPGWPGPPSPCGCGPGNEGQGGRGGGGGGHGGGGYDFTIEVPTYSFDANSCSIIEGTTTVTGHATPAQ